MNSRMMCSGVPFNYGYIGSRATGNELGDYLVVGPDWKGETPAGIKKVFRSTTQLSLADTGEKENLPLITIPAQ